MENPESAAVGGENLNQLPPPRPEEMAVSASDSEASSTVPEQPPSILSTASSALSANLITPEQWEVLRCDLCLNIPKGHVLNCRNGHSFCADCADKQANCKECGVDFTLKIRNLGLERVLDMKTFRCPFTEYGCTKDPMTRPALLVHQLRCEFNPDSINLGSVLAKLCSGAPSSSNSQVYEKCHLSFIPDLIMKNHSEVKYLINQLITSYGYTLTNVTLPESSTCKITTYCLSDEHTGPSSSSSSSPPKQEIFCNHVIHVTFSDVTVGILFVLFRLDSKEDKKGKKKRWLSIACVRLTPPQSSSDTDYCRDHGMIEFKIKGSRIEWRDEPISVQEFVSLMETEPGEMPGFKFSWSLSELRKYKLNSRLIGNDGKDPKGKLSIHMDFNPTEDVIKKNKRDSCRMM